MNRVGFGFDAHPFEAGRPLRLGGLTWDFDRGLAGHSDGDVLLHAVTDALLGAAGLGSLGEYFPSDDSAHRGRNSEELLREVHANVVRSFTVVNIDATVVGEAPKLSPRRRELTARLAALLDVPETRISVRGTSSNGLGFPGRGEGLVAMAVVLLESRRSPEGEGG